MQILDSIKIQRNIIEIQNPQSKAHYFILLSHPQRHSYISHDAYHHQFISNETQINDQFVGIAKVKNSQINLMVQGIITTQPLQTVDKEPLQIIYVSKYIALLNCCRPQLQQLAPQDVLLMIEYLKSYGQIKALVPQGNTLLVKYQMPKNIKNHFIVPKTSDLYTQKLSYFSISNRMPFGTRHRKLLSLPIQSKIQQIQIQSHWLIVRNIDSVLFLKMKQPFDNFHVFSLINPQRILTLMPQKIALSNKQFISLFKLKQDKVVQYSKIKLKGLEAHCFAKYGKNYLFAGINYQKKLLSTTSPSTERSIHLYNNFNQIDFKKQNTLTPNKIIYVCDSNNNYPITMLHYILEIESIACYCQKTIYIVTFNQETLAKANVENNMQSVLYMAYNFNLSNYIGLMDKNLLKIGLDVYDDKVGMQIQQFKSLGTVEFFILIPQLYISNGYSISKCELISQKISHSLIKTPVPITFMAGQGNTLVYLISHKNVYDLHCIILQ